MDRTYKPIAIIGYGCVFPPDGKNVKSFGRILLVVRMAYQIYLGSIGKKNCIIL